MVPVSAGPAVVGAEDSPERGNGAWRPGAVVAGSGGGLSPGRVGAEESAGYP